MYLLQLNARGQLSLAKHDLSNLPPYAILSHTWAADEDELTFQDVKAGTGSQKTGFAKVRFCGEQARKDGLGHFWVDSCCIDKTNSAELSESILSMFRWYQNSAKCYVFLQDVSSRKRDRTDQPQDAWIAAFKNSRWFTRGWTLQELIAPKSVEFFSRDQDLLGTKQTLEDLIHSTTEIPTQALRGLTLSSFPPNERLGWALKRDTKRIEDKAYCLFGIFDVFLPPMYGEGEYAFTRLQDEIVKRWSQLDPALVASCFSNPQTNRPENAYLATERSDCGHSGSELMASLAFEQMDARRSTIKGAQRTTCDWFMQDPIFLKWENADENTPQRDILWISGKPGAGKSTLMKFVHGQAEKSKDSDEIIVSFFFNARGDELEKTTLGLYRALLHQLLQQAPDLQCVLDEVIPTRDSPNPWTFATLRNTFSAAVTRLGQRRLKCYIDALDECDEKEIRDMVEYFEDIAEDANESGSRFRICFASRHYPTIHIRDGWKLILEDQEGHSEDLQKYIRRRLQAGSGKAVNDIRASLHEKANGVFMWAVLVVEILNEEYRRGRVFAVKKRLQEIPEKLSDLFQDILRRDNVNMDDLLLCLQWILFAQRPLRREEFYFAMIAGLNANGNNKNIWKPEPWDPEEVTMEHMNLFVLNSSKGLAELTKSKTPTVQFIHESVRDFLIKDGGLCEIWPQFANDLDGLSHDRLKSCCQAYLTADSLSTCPKQTSPEQKSADVRKQHRKDVINTFPFIEYACEHVFSHADEAAQTMSQQSFLSVFDLRAWQFISSIMETREIRRHRSGVSLLYIFADRNLVRLANCLSGDVTTMSWHKCHEERYGYPFLAAFANGHQNVLKLFLGENSPAFLSRLVEDAGFGKYSQVHSTRDPLLWAVENKNWALAEFLLSCLSDQNIFALSTKNRQNRHGRSTITLVAEYGPADLMQKLIVKGAEVQAEEDGKTALVWAITGANRDVVELLLDTGAYNTADIYPELVPPLEIASGKGPIEIVQLLLCRCESLQNDQKSYGYALVAAAYGGNINLVQWLLEHGAASQQDVKDKSGRTALIAACQQRHITIVQLLLAAGADVNIQDGDFGNALQSVCAGSGREDQDRLDLVELLLDNGAHINIKGGAYGSALQAACSLGYVRLIKLLLDRGADINIDGGVHDSALHSAIFFPYNDDILETVKLLLDRGAHVDTRRGSYTSQYREYEPTWREIWQMLEARGAQF